MNRGARRWCFYPGIGDSWRRGGFLLEPDAEALKKHAAASDVGGGGKLRRETVTR